MNSPSWECIAPILLALRGKSPSTKRHVYDQLDQEQNALFAFYAYYNHSAGSSDAFVRWTRIYFQNRWDRELANSRGFLQRHGKGSAYRRHESPD